MPDLRVRLADRSLRQTNPVLAVISQLLELADQRATASQLLDLADREPVRRRFGFDDDDVARMQDWVVASGIRWGLDAAHRAPYKLDVIPNGTWRAGLDRVLVGVAMTEEDRRLVGGVLPLDDVESGAIDLAGRFAEYVDRVQAAVDGLAGAKPVDVGQRRSPVPRTRSPPRASAIPGSAGSCSACSTACSPTRAGRRRERRST